MSGPERTKSKGDHSDFAHRDGEEMGVIAMHSFDKTLMITLSVLSAAPSALTNLKTQKVLQVA